MEGDPFALIEAMTIAAYATGCEHGYVYLRGEYPQAHAILGAAIDEAAAPRLPRRRRAGRGLRVRHRDPQGRRRLHLRRGDRDLQLDRGLPRRAAQQAAVPGRRRPVRQADGGQQRRDARQRAPDRARGRPRASPRPAPRARPGRSCSASRATSSARASTRCRSARRCASCSSWPAAWRAGAPLQAVLLGGAAGGFVRPDELDLPLTFEGAREARTTLGSGVVLVLDDTRRPAALPAAHRRLLPQRVVRAVRALPRRHRAPAGGARAARLGPHARRRGGRARADRRDRPVHARRLDLRPRPDRVERDRVGDRAPRRLRRCDMSSQPLALPQRMVELEIDGQPVRVLRGPDDPRRAAQARDRRRRRCATATRCSRPTPAASAWSSSRARACWRRPARARPRRA